MRRAGNSVVTGHGALSRSICGVPFVDRGVEGIGKFSRALFVMFQFSDDSRGSLLHFFALTESLAIILDNEGRADAKEDDEELASKPADTRTPILLLIRMVHFVFQFCDGFGLSSIFQRRHITRNKTRVPLRAKPGNFVRQAELD